MSDTVTNAQGWQPIATAPKDGTRVLLYPCMTGPHHKGKAVVGYGYWHQPGNPERMGFWMHAFNGSKRENLTHWMPLPDAPGTVPDFITIPQAEYKRLVEALESLAYEASGFVEMADRQTHGNTNIAVLKHHIAQAQAALKAAREGGNE